MILVISEKYVDVLKMSVAVALLIGGVYLEVSRRLLEIKDGLRQLW